MTLQCAAGDEVDRDYWVDYVRGFAALAVAFFHFNEVRPEIGVYSVLTSYGWLGVPAFFILSGYCINLAAQRTDNAGEFFIHRLFRIFPPYYFSLLVVLIVVAARVLATGTNDITQLPKTFEDVLSTVVLFLSPASNVEGINWVYWTLVYELAFYIVFAIALIRSQLTFPIVGGITICSIITEFAQLPGLFFLDHWGLFALGLGLSHLKQGQRIKASFVILGAGISIFVNQKMSEQITALLVAIFAVGVMMNLLTSKRLILPTGKFFGDISYSIYLLHVPIGVYALPMLVRPLRLDREVGLINAIAVDLSLIAGVSVVAYLSYLFVERPSIKLGRRFGARIHRRLRLA